MTIEEARALIRGVEWRGSRPGLSRVRELLHRIGDPQDTLQFVHIAGTNGKGSTAAMLAAVLQAAGYTTGLFTSPFLEQFAERMQVNGQPIPDAELAAACETLQPCIAAMDDQPTEFELVTAAAMLWFQRRGCDIVVLEVGLGGRLDATNVIGAPACAVITNIGLDHTEILGDTLAQIAREKAGILKPGTRAVSYPQVPEVRAVLENAGVSEEKLAGFQVKFEETFGDDAALSPRNLVDSKRMQLKTPDVIIQVAPDRGDLVETRTLGGVKYIMVRAEDGVELNGVDIQIDGN